ncbi:hypothetical protein OF83DRAFT_1148271, partial [Amylostereum chailletii]
ISRHEPMPLWLSSTISTLEPHHPLRKLVPELGPGKERSIQPPDGNGDDIFAFQPPEDAGTLLQVIPPIPYVEEANREPSERIYAHDPDSWDDAAKDHRVKDLASPLDMPREPSSIYGNDIDSQAEVADPPALSPHLPDSHISPHRPLSFISSTPGPARNITIPPSPMVLPHRTLSSHSFTLSPSGMSPQHTFIHPKATTPLDPETLATWKPFTKPGPGRIQQTILPSAQKSGEPHPYLHSPFIYPPLQAPLVDEQDEFMEGEESVHDVFAFSSSPGCPPTGPVRGLTPSAGNGLYDSDEIAPSHNPQFSMDDPGSLSHRYTPEPGELTVQPHWDKLMQAPSLPRDRFTTPDNYAPANNRRPLPLPLLYFDSPTEDPSSSSSPPRTAFIPDASGLDFSWAPGPGLFSNNRTASPNIRVPDEEADETGSIQWEIMCSNGRTPVRVAPETAVGLNAEREVYSERARTPGGVEETQKVFAPAPGIYLSPLRDGIYSQEEDEGSKIVVSAGLDVGSAEESRGGSMGSDHDSIESWSCQC